MKSEDKKALKEKLIERIEEGVMIICIVIITVCIVYAAIMPVRASRVKSAVQVGYERFKSVPVVDTTGTYPDPDSIVSMGDGVYNVIYR